MNTYNITDFGARSADSLQTAAIQSALDACFLEGGGTVLVPPGIYRTGGLRLRSNTTLRLAAGAMLVGSTDPEDYTGWISDKIEPITEYEHEGIARSAYPYSRWNNALIRAVDAQNIAIIGEPGAFIDGSDCFDEQGEEHYRGPHAINFWNCKNIRLEGYTIRNSANWAHAIFNTDGITAKNLSVYGGHDGFDVRTCDNVLIEDCTFITGDDCIAGFDNRDVIIRRCYMESACSALRFGGTRVLIEDCRGKAPAGYGFRGSLTPEKKRASAPTDETCRHTMHQAFLYYCDHRAEIRETPGEIVLRRCDFTGAKRVFSLDFDGKHIWCCNRSLRSIRFEDCSFAELETPIHIHGDASEPLIFELADVTLRAKEGCGDAALVDAVNFERIRFNNVTLDGYDKPAIVSDGSGQVDGGGLPVTIIGKDQ